MNKEKTYKPGMLSLWLNKTRRHLARYDWPAYLIQLGMLLILLLLVALL